MLMINKRTTGKFNVVATFENSLMATTWEWRASHKYDDAIMVINQNAGIVKLITKIRDYRIGDYLTIPDYTKLMDSQKDDDVIYYGADHKQALYVFSEEQEWQKELYGPVEIKDAWTFSFFTMSDSEGLVSDTAAATAMYRAIGFFGIY